MTKAKHAFEALRDEISTVLVGKERLIEQLTIALITRGHVLLEGVPGVAKTTAANAFANAVGLGYNRVQMTPDVMPADVTGTHVFDESNGTFTLQRGPIFSNLVVADEINRATPKTQSALLESMQEGQVTIEGDTLSLPTPFMLIATQNPIERDGTFELPEAQRDRFQFKLVVDPPERDQERVLLDRFDEDAMLSADDVDPVLNRNIVGVLRETVDSVYVASPVKEYVLDLVRTVREDEAVEVGASPRTGIVLTQAAKGRAAIRGREYVTPDDVKAMVPQTLRHRIVLSTEADFGNVTSEDVIDAALSTVEPPTGARRTFTADQPADDVTVGGK